MIAKVAVSSAVYAMDKPYTYRLPYGMQAQAGMRVKVPFGKGNRMIEGMVLSVEEGPEEGLKDVAELLDEQPVMNERMLRLCGFLRERYFCTLYDAIKAVLPAGLWLLVKQSYRILELPEDWKSQLSRKPEAIRFLEALQELGGAAEETALARMLPDPV